jgi:hypothetical protein
MTVPRFWRTLKNRYQLLGTRCKNCSSVYFPPRKICPKCRRAGRIEDYRLSGGGEIITYTKVHSAPPNFERQLPYTLAIVRLDEGPRILAQVVGSSPEIGSRVEAVFRKIGEEDKRGVLYYGVKFKVRN